MSGSPWNKKYNSEHYERVIEEITARQSMLKEVCLLLKDKGIPAWPLVMKYARKNNDYRKRLTQAIESLPFPVQAKMQNLGERFRKKLKDLCSSGKTSKEISQLTGVRQQAVIHQMRKWGISTTRGGFKHYTLEDMRKLAESYGGKCLSLKYEGVLNALRWQCEKGHQFEKTPRAVIDGYWCAVCKRINYIQAQIEDVKTAVAKHGGRIVGFAQIRRGIIIRLACSRGHEWTATLDRLVKGEWCPVCTGLVKPSRSYARRHIPVISIDQITRAFDNVPNNLKDLKAMAKERGGRCLSTEFQGIFKKHLWQCTNRHQFHATPYVVICGSWCPVCSPKKRK